MTQRISICPHCRDTYPDFDVAHVCSRGPYAPKLKAKMNNRIQELSEQAEKYADYNFKGEPFWSEAYESKFAELIVRECARLCDINDKEQGDILREHFGVDQ
jgi:hypothetical protein